MRRRPRSRRTSISRIIGDGTAEIALTRGMVTLVDACDFEYLEKWNWCASLAGTTWYARRGISDGTTIYMHREVAARMDSSMTFVDHADRNGLNNRRSNLRGANQSQNIANGGMWKNNTSGYRGVTFSKRDRTWQAGTKHKGKFISLGRYATPEEAAVAYNREMVRRFGEFAFQNHVKEATAT